MTPSMTRTKKVCATFAAVVFTTTMGLTACSGSNTSSNSSNGNSSGSTDGNSARTFTVLQYEDPTSAQGQGWQKALQIFKAKHPNVTVKYEKTSFDAVRQNAKITLSGNNVPDAIEFNKGNADGGQLAAQGLLAPLTEQATQRGWDKKVTGSMAAFAKYDQDGHAGAGDWYGVPDIGEYVMFYYNKDMFAKADVKQPPTSFAEFEKTMDKLKAAGYVPLSSSAATSQGFNQMWVWYSLVSAVATRQQIDDFMFVRGNVDFHSGPWLQGTNTFQDWIKKGYVGEKLGGLTFEQATVNFLSAKKPMLIWNNGEFGRIRKQAKFKWGYFTLPGANLSMGSSGHLWGVPAKAKNKDLAYDWIDATLSPEVQNKIGQLGGLPLAGDASTITDPVTRQVTVRFDQLVKADTLSFYPDYPVPGFLDFIQSHMQAMSNGNETADQYLTALQKFYDSGKKG